MCPTTTSQVEVTTCNALAAKAPRGGVRTCNALFAEAELGGVRGGQKYLASLQRNKPMYLAPLPHGACQCRSAHPIFALSSFRHILMPFESESITLKADLPGSPPAPNCATAQLRYHAASLPQMVELRCEVDMLQLLCCRMAGRGQDL